jgi:hypothetical protein
MLEHYDYIPKNIQKNKRRVLELSKKRVRFLDLIGRGKAPESMVEEVAKLDFLIREVQNEITLAEQAATGIPKSPSMEWIVSQVKDLRAVLEQNTERSALLIRKLVGRIILEPSETDEGKKFYIAKTKLNTFSLLHGPEKGTNSGQWWRWGESNPRP